MVTLRMRLSCEIRRAGQTGPGEVYEVLNEMVVDRGSNSYLTNIEVYEKGRFITRVQADGVMLATPTGTGTHARAGCKHARMGRAQACTHARAGHKHARTGRIQHGQGTNMHARAGYGRQ